jgi:hypothetical protein
MSRPSRFLPAAVGVFLLAIAPVAGAATPRLALQIDGTTYESPQFGYVVTWDDQWGALDRHVISEDDEFDQMQLTNNDGRLWVTGYPDDVDPDAAMARTVERFAGTADDVLVLDASDQDGIVTQDLIIGRDRLLVDAQAVDDVTVVVALFARESRYEDALEAARSGITINGGTVLSGEPLPATSRPAPTEEPDPTAEATDEPEPTPDPDATEAPTEAPTGITFTGDTYESGGFGYSLTLPEGWSFAGGEATSTSEQVILTNGTSTITLLATSAYAGDLPGCIAYARSLVADDPAYDDLRLQTTATGEPFRGNDDRSAFALFSYPGADGEPWAWYVQCRPIVEGESVLILMQDVPRDAYQEQRGARAAVINAIDMP